MFVGAIVIGGHYFVDLLGGVAVAGLCLAAAGRVVERLAAATKPA
jgi:membrane-associated phospholipid phosphatase